MSDLSPHDELAELSCSLREWLEFDALLSPSGFDDQITLSDPPAVPREGRAHAKSSSRADDGPFRQRSTRPPVRPGAPPPPPPGLHSPPSLAPRPPQTVALASSGGQGGDSLQPQEEALKSCQSCVLEAGQANLVYGAGNPKADIVFVGEGPLRHESKQTDPFDGAAGELLDKIIQGVFRLGRSDVYICSVAKCRSPGDRGPLPEEVAACAAACAPHLKEQLARIKPAVVVGLGPFAVQILLGTDAPVGQLRGRAHPFGDACLVPTYHPAYLLQNPGDKRKVFEDMKLVRSEYENRTGKTLGAIASGRRR